MTTRRVIQSSSNAIIQASRTLKQAKLLVEVQKLERRARSPALFLGFAVVDVALVFGCAAHRALTHSLTHSLARSLASTLLERVPKAVTHTRAYSLLDLKRVSLFLGNPTQPNLIDD